MSERRSLPVPDGLAGERADVALARMLGLSRSKAADLLDRGDATLDGAVLGRSSADGTRVRTVTTPAGQPAKVTDYLVDPWHQTSAAGRALVLSQVVAEIDGTGALTAYHVRGDDLLATLRPNTTTPGTWIARHFHAEGIGTIRALTDEAGAISDRYDLEAFGTLLQHQGDDANAYLFAGEPLDPNSGFYYNRARWLDGIRARFIAADPLGGAIARPASLNRYAYAEARPDSLLDPTGLFAGGVAEINIVSAIQSIVTEIQANIGFSLINGASTGGEVNLSDFFFSVGILGVAVAGKVIKYAGRTGVTIWQTSKVRRAFRALGVVRPFASQHGRLKEYALSRIWELEDRIRGIAVQRHLAVSEYSNWYPIGDELNGFFPLIDFQTGTRVGSLKTTRVVDLAELREHLDDLAAASIFVGDVPAERVLDVRIAPWLSASSFEEVVSYGNELGITVLVRNFP